MIIAIKFKEVSLKYKVINYYLELKKLLSELPTVLTSIFILSFVLMNVFAGKEISFGFDWIALDCGIVTSWYIFLFMDIITRNFGAKATIKISCFALFFNFLVVIIFCIVAFIPGNWAQYYVFNSGDINTAINNTFISNWYIVFGSYVAFLFSSILNALLNQAIGKLFKKYSLIEFISRSYISTLISQFVDNMIFALIVSMVLFGWNLTQCCVCALIGCIVESLFELVFCPLGYYISEKYRKKLKHKINF